MVTVYLNKVYGYRLFMDDFGDDWCATLSYRGPAQGWVVVAIGPCNPKPKKGK